MSRPEPTLDALLAHRPWVRSLARALVRDDATADDLEQEVWAAAVARPPRDLAAPRAWLGSVLRRRAARTHRDAFRRARRERDGARPDAAPDVADVVAAAEAHRHVVNAVAALDEPFRTAVLLRFFEGLGPSEAAARLGVPVETVRSRVRRGLEAIRVALRARWGDDDRAEEALLALALPGAGVPDADATPGDGGRAARLRVARMATVAAALLAAIAAAVVAVVRAGSLGRGVGGVPDLADNAAAAAPRRAGPAGRARPPGRARAEAAQADDPPPLPAPRDKAQNAAATPGTPPVGATRVVVVDGPGPDARPLAGATVHVVGAGSASQHAATGDDASIAVDAETFEGERAAVVWASAPGRSFARRETALDGKEVRIALPAAPPVGIRFRRTPEAGPARAPSQDAGAAPSLYAAAAFPERVAAVADLGTPPAGARAGVLRLDPFAADEFDLGASEEEDRLTLAAGPDPAGAFRLVVTTPAGVPWVSPRLRADVAGRVSVEVPLPPAVPVRRVRAVNAVTGEPLPAALVGAVRTADDGRTFERWVRATDDAGVVELPPAEDGVTWWVMADGLDARLDGAHPGAAPRPLGSSAPILEASPADVRVARTATVRGKAPDGVTTPAGSRVLVLAGPRTFVSFTDEAGEFAVEDVVAPADGDAEVEVFLVLAERPLRHRRGTAHVAAGAAVEVRWDAAPAPTPATKPAPR